MTWHNDVHVMRPTVGASKGYMGEWDSEEGHPWVLQGTEPTDLEPRCP